MNYKALLLDLDDTLIMSNRIYNKALEYAAKFLSDKYELDDKEFFHLSEEKYKLLSKNFPTVHTRHSRILLFRAALDESLGAGNYDIGVLPDVEDIYWEYFLNNIKVYPEVPETLEEIREMGIKTAIVSDGDLSLRIRKLKAADLLKYVNEVVASEEVIFEKPFSAIFTLALSRLNVEPHEAIMLGNNYKNDIRGAHMVNIKAGAFLPEKYSNPQGRTDSIIPDFIIKEFSDIIDELKNGG